MLSEGVSTGVVRISPPLDDGGCCFMEDITTLWNDESGDSGDLDVPPARLSFI